MPPNQVLASRFSVIAWLPSPKLKVPSACCCASTAEVNVKAAPSMVPSTMIDAFWLAIAARPASEETPGSVEDGLWILNLISR